ncbi:hypothetical protein P280DRAFT_433094 [Massarina eburnea CBS 473.64]|uniref:RRM domain-containing protein n=1 Tax=Massarina eburnea CBS 473.64 TaxID=1395130 RepID=A0A6A6RRY6_9PLEO|nr:hypothetical protein P280DRAFT_433094 [Massarina eburnea CBS 473.64]
MKSSDAPKRKPPTKVGTFTILPLTLPTLSGLASAQTETHHYLYVQPHAPPHPTSSSARSLFMTNIPPDATETNIRALFNDQLGGVKVEGVEFESAIPGLPVHKRWKGGVAPGAMAGIKRKREGEEAKRSDGKDGREDSEVVAEGVVEDEKSTLPRTWGGEVRASGSTAVVVFVDRESLSGAWKEVRRVVKQGVEVRWKAGEGVGVGRYKTHATLQYPSPTHLTTTTAAYLAQFDTIQTLRNRMLAKSRSVADEDGFITVTRGGGRTAPAARLELVEQKRDELEERKKKNAVKDDFYRFQNREKRKEEESRLRRGFEKDRQRVLEMRERRGRVVPER